MVDIRNVGLGDSLTKRPIADRLHLVIHARQGSIRHPDPGPGEYPAHKLGADHRRELPEGHRSSMGGSPEPLLQVGQEPGRVPAADLVDALDVQGFPGAMG